MKFCISSDLDIFRYKHDPIEVLNWLPSENDIDKLEKAILKYKNYDMVLAFWSSSRYDEDEYLAKINTILTIHKDEIKNVRLAFYKDALSEESIEKLKEWGIKFFYLDKVSSYYQLEEFKNDGVCDMYLVAEMGFSLDKASKVLHEAGIRVRACPNICQKPSGINPLIGFFIAPEHIKIYEPYIDILEIVEDETKNFSVVYNVYAHQGKWFGKYEEIITDFHGDLDGLNLPILFAERRMGCDLKCLKGNNCRMCYTMNDLCKTLTEKNIYIKEEA